jgi:hypothetical protein
VCRAKILFQEPPHSCAIAAAYVAPQRVDAIGICQYLGTDSVVPSANAKDPNALGGPKCQSSVEELLRWTVSIESMVGRVQVWCTQGVITCNTAPKGKCLLVVILLHRSEDLEGVA